MPYSDILNKSIAVQQFVKNTNLTENRLHELFFECFCSYMDMFRERLKYARQLKKVIAMYKGISGFGQKTPEQVVKAMFASRAMHEWFAYRFVYAADKQLMAGIASIGELQIALTFTGEIPTQKSMEEIINGKNKKREPRVVCENETAARGANRATGRTGNRSSVGV